MLIFIVNAKSDVGRIKSSLPVAPLYVSACLPNTGNEHWTLDSNYTAYLILIILYLC